MPHLRGCVISGQSELIEINNKKSIILILRLICRAITDTIRRYLFVDIHVAIRGGRVGLWRECKW